VNTPWQISVLITFGYPQEKELVNNVATFIDSHGNLQLQPLIENLKAKGYDLQNNMVSFYDPCEGLFVHLGTDPLSTECIPAE